MDTERFANAMNRAAIEAPFLAAAMARHPDLTQMLYAGKFSETLAAAARADGANVRQTLRRRRDAMALVIAIGDLAGHLSFEGVVSQLSEFADYALAEAIGQAMRSRVPDAEPVGFVAIALGKHGSQELNYSSDIDPILLFDPVTIPRRARDDPAEAAVRIAHDVVGLLQTRDGDGYVLRVDLRLRPASEATPLAIPVNGAIFHYESSALAWERAAFIRARAAAGDVALGQGFLSTIQPFIWRRSLDFGTVEELRALSQRIRAHAAGGQIFGPGFDLKRGRGGIREVEFFVQIHQLIHGGRDESLRVADTLGAIGALASAGRIGSADAATLADAYRLFRTIEHRLQMIDDRQTHRLPVEPAALDGVARLHGLDDGQALLALLAPHVAAVGALYDGLAGPAHIPVSSSDEDLAGELKRNGFAEPSRAMSRISEWRRGKLRAVRSDVSRTALEKVLPALLSGFGEAADPDAALNAFDAMLEQMPTALNLFRLLEAQPRLIQLLAHILSHAPTLAEALGQNTSLLDTLLDASAFATVSGVPELEAAMRRGDRDLERRLDEVRRVVADHRFALGVQIVEATDDPVEIAAGYARIAEAAVRVVADAVVEPFVAAHGRIPGSGLIILALGRLGGGLMTHASDLDLVYLFSGDFAAVSDGAHPLGGSHYYNRLGQRLSSGLSAPTAAGFLYDVDTRLRPSGGDGPLVASLDSFESYQRERAWTWEHMALTRARVIYGDVADVLAVKRIIHSILSTNRDTASLARDVVTMRAEMNKHKPPKGPLDVKLQPGGLVDLEFIVHFHQLAQRVGLDPHLPSAIAALVAAGLVRPQLGDAHALLTRLIVTLRLISPGLHVPSDATTAIVARSCRADSWDDLLARLSEARHCVEDHWRFVVEQAGN